ncbi:hypothetical protein MMAG44476_22177 [Mycolicibacterium mageritense DSM 44476 = CIP 104973]|nr:hypothetical protein AWB94_07535 [Mycolicibacterium canariasense]
MIGPVSFLLAVAAATARHRVLAPAPKGFAVNGTAFASGVGPWLSVVILSVSAFSAMAILARYGRHTAVQRPALLALPIAVTGAVLALLVILVPYLIASPPIDDRALAASIGTGRWLWPAVLAATAWAWVTAYSVRAARLFHRQQPPWTTIAGYQRWAHRG